MPDSVQRGGLWERVRDYVYDRVEDAVDAYRKAAGGRPPGSPAGPSGGER